MILDKTTLFADGIAFGTAATEIDLGNAAAGPGKPIKCFFIAHTVMTAMTAITVLDAPHTVPDEALMTVAAVAPAAGTTIEFDLPSTTQQFVNIAVTGATAGTYSAGIVLEGVQTNV